MLSVFPASTLFLASLITGTLLALSSNQWLIMWIGLEINLMSFIPLIMQTNQYQETEAAIKYFLAQALGSGLLLCGGIALTNNPLSFMPESTSMICLMMGLLTKLGMAPFHFWLPSTMASISWMSCLILSTWQKIGPMLILTYTMTYKLPLLMITSISISTLISGICGLNQSQLRPLLAYSSIGHMAWMMTASLLNQTIMLLYLFTYILISTPLFLYLHLMNLNTRSISMLMKQNPIFMMNILILLLSLGGLPPLLGFLPKWMTIQEMMINNLSPLLMMFLIMGSLMNLFYYIMITMNLFMYTSYYKERKHHTTPLPQLFMMTGSLSLGTTPMMLMFI